MTAADEISAEFLAGVELFASLSAALREQLIPAFDLVRVPAGSWLFRRGDPGDSLMVVRTGRLEVVVDLATGSQRAALIGPGGVLGELALLLGGVRTASVRALRETEVLQLRKPAFDQLLRDEPAFAAAITRALAHELQRRVPEARPPTREVAVVALVGVTSPLPVGSLAQALCVELGAWGRATHLEAPDGAFSEAELGRTIGALEGAHDTVFLVAPTWGDADGWARFCVRQADAVLAVVDPRTPAPAGVEPELAGCDLLLLTDVNHEDRRLVGWIDRLDAAAHHLVSPGGRQREDLARLARRLTGHSLGVILSGGGARGLAHIGVLATLLEAGFVIDRVGGTSMGSLVSGLFALGYPPEEMEELCRAQMVEQNPFNDYTLPRRGLIKARKAERMLTRLFGDAQVENTRRSLFTVSADLVTGREIIHRRGRVVVAVGASMSLPGLVAPVGDGNRLLVDGGVLNNLPVDVMAERAEGPILAIDVMRKDAPPPSGGAPPPSLVETLARSSVLGSRRKNDRNRLRADMVITPELLGVGLLDYRYGARVIAEGRKAGELALSGDLSGLAGCGHPVSLNGVRPG